MARTLSKDFRLDAQMYQGATSTLFHAHNTAVAIGNVSIPLASSSSVLSVGGSHILSVAGLVSDAVSVQGYTGATDASANLIPIDVTTGQFASGTALANGVYSFPYGWPFSKYAFTKAAATEACSVVLVTVTAPK